MKFIALFTRSLLFLVLTAPTLWAQFTDELRVFPATLNLTPGTISEVPLIAISIYDDGWIQDATHLPANGISVADPTVAEVVPVTYSEGDDLYQYWYIRGLALGTTQVTVTSYDLSGQITVNVSQTIAEPPSLEEIPMRLGTVLTDLSNSSSDLVFADVFMTAQPWVSSTEDGWGDYDDPDFEQEGVDNKGWVRRLLPGQIADTMMMYALDGHYPKGAYTLTWEGSGTISVEHGWTGTTLPRTDHPDQGLRHIAEIQVGQNDTEGLRLRLRAVNPNDPIRNIHLWMPEDESGINPCNAGTPPAQPFREDYLQEMGQYHCLRFGIWQLAMDGTDNQAVQWNQVTPVDNATQFTPWGASPEWAVRLINTLNNRTQPDGTPVRVDPWINIPYLADESYIRGMAELMATQLDFAANPQLRVYVEWANEVWNPAFLHLYYAANACGNVSPSLGCNGELFHDAFAFQAHQSLEVFAIFEDVFTQTHPVPGGMDRLCRVLAGSASNPYGNGLLLGRPGIAEQIDAFAIAPYFGGQVGIDVNQWPPLALPTVAQLLDMLDNPGDPDNLANSDLEQRIREMAHTKALIDVWNHVTGRNIEMVGYESGQHVVGLGYDTRPDVVPLFAAANADERMGDMYRRLYLSWHQIGGGLINHFVHREKWWEQGFFGALTWYDENALTSGRPKYQALLEALAGNTQ